MRDGCIGYVQLWSKNMKQLRWIGIFLKLGRLYWLNRMESRQHSPTIKRIQTRISEFLVNETNIPPLLYFLGFLYFHLPLQAGHRTYDLIFFLVAVAAAIACNFNFIFTLAPFVRENLGLAVPMFLLGLFSCTQKWKIYIFILQIGDQWFQEDFSRSYFLAAFSLLICFETYRGLIFRTIEDNLHYFVGMALVSLYYCMHIFIKSYQLPINAWVIALILFSAASLATAIMEHRIAGLRKMEPEKIYLQRELAHFLRMTQGDINQPFISQMKLAFHLRKCQRSHCFCHNPQFRNKSEYLMRQLYENAIRKYDRKRETLLIEYYIDFLIRNKQSINALHYLAQWQPQSYFQLVCHWRARAKIDKFLADQNSSNIYEKEYVYALEYDRHSLSVAVQINKILKLKLRFWHEINREAPRVAQLQKMGHEIIALMHRLNVFYNKVIKDYQQKIFVFDSTVLYAMYMLSTTNFKEYAEIIIKNTAKLLEDVYVFQNNASETFALRAVVKNQAKSLSDSHRKNLQPISAPKVEQAQGCRHHLVIDAVSNSLCKMLHLNKSQIVDNQLKVVIPGGYRQVHDVRLNYLLDFQSQLVGKIIPSRILHRQIKLPMRAANGELLIGYLCIKYQLDIDHGLTFITIVKLVHDRSKTLLMDFSGNITEIQQGFNLQVIKHSEVKKYLNKIRSSWISQRDIRQQKFNLMMNAANYSITIGAPFINLFMEKEQMKDKCPPIHIEVLNEETVKNKNVLQGDKNNKLGRQIKHMQSALQTYDSESSNNSSKGGISAVNILTVFSQNNTVPLYRFLYIAFVAIITCCIVSNIGAYLVAQLPWDNTTASYNPLNDTMNFNALHMLTIKTMITLQDQVLYFKEQDSFNTTRISQYFGFEDYQASVVNFTQKLLYAYQSNIYNILGTPSEFLAQHINAKLQTGVTIPNPNGSTQTLTYLQLLMVYVTDLSLMTQLKLSSTIIAETYSPTIASAQNCSYFSQLIDQGVSAAQRTSIAVHLSLMTVMTILLIPLFYLLRSRLSLHQKIFDLLASIDPSQVSKEIKSLEYVCNILRNYKQSNEIMKMNVLDYEENMIHPKRGNEKRSSVDNDLVLGLERYDVGHLREESEEEDIRASRQSVESFKISVIKNKRSRGVRTSKINSQIKDNFINTKGNFNYSPRKRAGQLDLSGSILDPSNKIIGLHWIVYIISTSFLIFLIFSLSLNLSYNTTYIAHKNQILAIYSKQISFQQHLLTIKTYLTQGASAIETVFGVSSELQVILPALIAVPSYNYFDGDAYYSQVDNNCSSGVSPASTFLQKYCQYNYSEVVLRGQFGAIFKQLTELRYALDHNLTLYQDSSTTLLNIKQKFYYLQSLNLRMQELVLDKITLLFDQIIALTRQYDSGKLELLMVSVIWGLVCCLLGLVIVLRMKEGYFKEVFMITFLNNGMIVKNKRVQSFLDSIAKNSYS